MFKLFQNTSLRILLITDGLQVMAATMIGPIYAIFVEQNGGSIIEAGFAGAAFAFAAGCTSLLVGKYSDSLENSELVLILGYLILGGSYFSFIFAQNVLGVIAIQIALGLGAALQAPVFDAIYSRHLDKHNEGVEWGAWESSNYFVNAVGAAAGGVIAANFGFNTLFLVLAALCFGSAIIAITFKSLLSSKISHT